jgi:hypothetical protein
MSGQLPLSRVHERTGKGWGRKGASLGAGEKGERFIADMLSDQYDAPHWRNFAELFNDADEDK